MSEPLESPTEARRRQRGDAPKAQGGSAKAAARTQPAYRIGRVKSFSVGEDGLRIKLDISAIARTILLVGPDEPHFRAAVSVTMLAYNARYNRGEFNEEPTIDNQYLAARIETAPQPNGVEVATAVGLGKDAFDYEDWIRRPEDFVNR